MRSTYEIGGNSGIELITDQLESRLSREKLLCCCYNDRRLRISLGGKYTIGVVFLLSSLILLLEVGIRNCHFFPVLMSSFDIEALAASLGVQSPSVPVDDVSSGKSDAGAGGGSAVESPL